ncbi:MAG: hypothetical protein ACLFTT_05820 [Candidatus Hydrogenedentota bacterium]
MSNDLRERIDNVRIKALALGVLGVLVTLPALLFTRELFFGAWLVAFIFVFMFAAGGLATVLLRHLAGGAWSVILQRISEAAARTLWMFVPVFALIFYFAHDVLYPWTVAGYVAGHTVVQAKESYLNMPFFWLRFAGFFMIWLGLTGFYSHFSKKLDETEDARYAIWMQRLSAPALILFFVTMTLAATDWGMSLEPTWYSTIYGPLWIVSQGLSLLALAIIVLTSVDHEPPVAGNVHAKIYINIGNMFLAFVVLWSYFSFSQFLIVWSGNLPEEISWYLRRSEGGLVTISFLLALFHFLVPMLLLLYRRTKGGVIPLRRLACAVIVMRFIDIYWNIVPSFEGYANRIGWGMTFFAMAAAIGLGGIWLWYFLHLLAQRPLVPEHDPRARILLAKEKEAASHA